MTRILGIDPGSRITGYGVIEISGQKSVHIASGCIKSGKGELPERLQIIFNEVSKVVREFQPDQMAVEQVFMHRNADSALKLGQARGAAICACTAGELTVSEYSPRQIKQAIVGKGSADKLQVQHMVKVLLGLSSELQEDAADALAVALCHGHTSQSLTRLPQVRGIRRGRLR